MSDEIWEELSSLNGNELSDYLISVGIDPDRLVHDYERALEEAKGKQSK